MVEPALPGVSVVSSVTMSRRYRHLILINEGHGKDVDNRALWSILRAKTTKMVTTTFCDSNQY